MTTIVKGYASIGNYIIELEIDTTIANNLNRKVVDKNHAKYRCEKAFVIKIYDKYTEEEVSSVKDSHDPHFIYEKDKYIYVLNYDYNIDEVCTTGISFFLSKETAYFCNIIRSRIITGEYKQWYHNGQLYEKCNFIDGKKEGSYERYYINGQSYEKYNYTNDKKNGPFESWYDNGQLCEKYNYINDEQCGPYIMWYDNGQIYEKSYYVNDKKEGLFEEYYKNGILRKKCNYEAGKEILIDG